MPLGQGVLPQLTKEQAELKGFWDFVKRSVSAAVKFGPRVADIAKEVIGEFTAGSERGLLKEPMEVNRAWYKACDVVKQAASTLSVSLPDSVLNPVPFSESDDVNQLQSRLKDLSAASASVRSAYEEHVLPKVHVAYLGAGPDNEASDSNDDIMDLLPMDQLYDQVHPYLPKDESTLIHTLTSSSLGSFGNMPQKIVTGDKQYDEQYHQLFSRALAGLKTFDPSRQFDDIRIMRSDAFVRIVNPPIFCSAGEGRVMVHHNIFKLKKDFLIGMKFRVIKNVWDDLKREFVPKLNVLNQSIYEYDLEYLSTDHDTNPSSLLVATGPILSVHVTELTIEPIRTATITDLAISWEAKELDAHDMSDFTQLMDERICIFAPAIKNAYQQVYGLRGREVSIIVGMIMAWSLALDKIEHPSGTGGHTIIERYSKRYLIDLEDLIGPDPGTFFNGLELSLAKAILSDLTTDIRYAEKMMLHCAVGKAVFKQSMAA